MKKNSSTKKAHNSLFFISLFFIFFSVSLVSTSLFEKNIYGNPLEVIKDYFIEATKGNIAGQETINKFGENLDVGTAEEDIQSQGGTLIFLQGAEKISLISSDTTNDIVGGANASSVEIIGLDENFTQINEIVNLSATPTNTTQEFIRVYRIKVHEVGNYGSSNEGTITGTAVTSGTVQIEIPVGEGQSKTTHYTVPKGKSAIITRIAATVNTGKDVDIKLKVRDNADDIISPYSPTRTLRDVRGIAVPISGEPKANLKLDEKTDIWAVGVTTAGATSKIEVNFDMVVYDA